MLKVILDSYKPIAEEIIAEEQAGFRAGRSTTEQIFNLRILCEKYIQHQQTMSSLISERPLQPYGVSMRKYNISANLAALRQGYKCSLEEWQYGRKAQHISRSKARMSSVIYPLQHFSRTDHV